jgi:ABC-type transport system involved in multi-copper enzyme maturation permease subunit
MGGITRAELLKLRKRPATWVLAVVGLYFVVVSYYVINFTIFYLARAGKIRLDMPLSMQLDTVLPHMLIKNVMEGISFYVAFLAIILGAMSAGSEYSWGTLKTIYAQRASRTSIYVAQTLAMAVATGLLTIALFVLSACTSWVMAISEHASTKWPHVAGIPVAMGAAWLILMMYAALGQLLGALFRNPAPAIGVGIGWVFVVEGTFIGLFSLTIDWLAKIQEWLPSANATTLSASWGQPGVSDNTPVLLPVSGPQYVWVPAAYLIGAVLLGAWLTKSRDIR